MTPAHAPHIPYRPRSLVFIVEMVAIAALLAWCLISASVFWFFVVHECPSPQPMVVEFVEDVDVWDNVARLCWDTPGNVMAQVCVDDKGQLVIFEPHFPPMKIHQP